MNSIADKIKSYQTTTFPALKDHYESLSEGQTPHTLFITCSDSRVCPNEITGTKAGDLFVIRNAGNLIPEFNSSNPSNEGLTLEYGVCALSVKEIVVCGHAKCGAMAALADLSHLDSLPLVQKGLSQYKEANASEVNEQKDLDSLISWNVKRQLKTLLDYPFIKERVSAGTLNLHGIVYNFVNADITFRCQIQADGSYT